MNQLSSHSKPLLATFWNMQTPYGAISYQTPTLKNCKPFKTQLCESLLAAHEIQTLNTYTIKPKSFQKQASLKLRNLLLHNDYIKKLKLISITRSSAVNNSINSYLNRIFKYSILSNQIEYSNIQFYQIRFYLNKNSKF